MNLWISSESQDRKYGRFCLLDQLVMGIPRISRFLHLQEILTIFIFNIYKNRDGLQKRNVKKQIVENNLGK